MLRSLSRWWYGNSYGVAASPGEQTALLRTKPAEQLSAENKEIKEYKIDWRIQISDIPSTSQINRRLLPEIKRRLAMRDTAARCDSIAIQYGHKIIIGGFTLYTFLVYTMLILTRDKEQIEKFRHDYEVAEESRYLKLAEWPHSAEEPWSSYHNHLCPNDTFFYHPEHDSFFALAKELPSPFSFHNQYHSLLDYCAHYPQQICISSSPAPFFFYCTLSSTLFATHLLKELPKQCLPLLLSICSIYLKLQTPSTEETYYPPSFLIGGIIGGYVLLFTIGGLFFLPYGRYAMLSEHDRELIQQQVGVDTDLSELKPSQIRQSLTLMGEVTQRWEEYQDTVYQELEHTFPTVMLRMILDYLAPPYALRQTILQKSDPEMIELWKDFCEERRNARATGQRSNFFNNKGYHEYSSVNAIQGSNNEQESKESKSSVPEVQIEMRSFT